MAQAGLDGKAVLVTGAAFGLGRATALEFAKAGAQLAILDVRADRLEETQQAVEALGASCLSLVLDVSIKANCVQAVEAVVARYGKLDVLCNCAGILSFDNLVDISAERWERTFAVNVHGPFYTSQAAIPHLIRSKGNIVNVASSGAVRSSAYTMAYSASKAALVHMTRCMAQEFIDEPVRINAVAPGGMATGIAENARPPANLNPWLMQQIQGRRPIMDPIEVARVVAFIASDEASAIHGACVLADNGLAA